MSNESSEFFGHHVHCKRCLAPVEIIDGTDEYGYYEGTVADHECGAETEEPTT